MMLDIDYASCKVLLSYAMRSQSHSGVRGTRTEKGIIMAKRKNTFTRFIEDIVDDTKDFVDDLIDRAKDIEVDARDAVTDVVDDDEDDKASDQEVAQMRATLDQLKAKIDELTALQKK